MLTNKEIENDLAVLQKGFHILTKKLKKFDILDKSLVPEGLKPHTRSISWLAEQVIVQQARKHISALGFDKVVAAESDIEQYDCKVTINGKETLVNLKVSAAQDKQSKNDINKAFKLQQIFALKPDTRLYYVIIKIGFQNTTIIFVDEPPITFYVPWVNNIYVNPSNHHLQDNYDSPMVKRTVQDFVDLIENELVKKNLPKK